jgi:hypothetical protein
MSGGSAKALPRLLKISPRELENARGDRALVRSKILAGGNGSLPGSKP